MKASRAIFFGEIAGESSNGNSDGNSRRISEAEHSNKIRRIYQIEPMNQDRSNLERFFFSSF